MVTSIPALAISIPAARSANSGSSSTSCIGSSYDEKAVTGVAVRRSCGQPEIWSAGSKHDVTALRSSSQRSDCYAGSSPPRIDDVSGRPRFILPASPIPRSRFPCPPPALSCGRPAQVTAAPARTLTPSPATARQRTSARDCGQPGEFSRRYRVSLQPATTVMRRSFVEALLGGSGVPRVAGYSPSLTAGTVVCPVLGCWRFATSRPAALTLSRVSGDHTARVIRGHDPRTCRRRIDTPSAAVDLLSLPPSARLPGRPDQTRPGDRILRSGAGG